MKKVILFFPFLIAVQLISAQQKPTAKDPLLSDFQTPPNTAKPRVWWHWMNGNITKDGVEKDLLWMHRSGIGGFQNFDAAMATPQIVEKRLAYMTPAWIDVFKRTAKLADSLKLEMAIAGSPGWSESGGPWVEPKDGMKKLVWAELLVRGNSKISIQVPAIPTTTGPIQNIPYTATMEEVDPNKPIAVFSKSIAVIAYKLHENDIPLSELNPEISSSGGKFTVTQLSDGDLATTSPLPVVDKGLAWIQFKFPKPTTIKAVTIVGGGEPGTFGFGGSEKDARTLWSSNDGTNFEKVCILEAGNLPQLSVNIPITTATYFKVTFKNPPKPADFSAIMGGPTSEAKAPTATNIAELVLHTATRIHKLEEKSGIVGVSGVPLDMRIWKTIDSKETVDAKNIIDLTNSVDKNGILNWTAPAGIWKIVHFGYSLQGIVNHPASPEATGLEVDKLDPIAINKYFENYLNQYKKATGGLMGTNGGLQYMVTDSYEAGSQNWTNNMASEFEKRRGYSLFKWLPVLTGTIITSSEASENFLWDLRKTISEMVAEYHYDNLTTILAKYGMKRYTESHESGRALIADGMEIKRKASIPMSAMWTPNAFINQNDQTGYVADIRESASVAHLYGQNLVAAESFTALGIMGAAWSYSPAILKPTADLELASGLNRFVVHTSVHQPVDDKFPGLGLGPFGQWFNRHETWAEQAKAWTGYLSRSSYLLQQGKFVADILYYYGEDNNITSLFKTKLPAIPKGYNYDFVNADALTHILTVKNNSIQTASGMQYKVLVLDENAKQMTLPVAKAIYELVQNGATVIGPKPTGNPSLADNAAEYKKIIEALWGGDATEKTVGKGKVILGSVSADQMQKLAISPDFSANDANANLLYVHRKLNNRDIYWINNRKAQEENVEVNCRVSGKTVEIWHAENGKSEKASYSFDGKQTKVSLHLDANDAVFLIFKEPTTVSSYKKPATATTTLVELKNKWTVNFQKDRGAPASIEMNELKSLTENENPGVKYFSGLATYSSKLNVKTEWLNKGSLVLNLGAVKELAEIWINGKLIGTSWRAPYKIELGNALHAGENQLEIKVANLWVNRLIGDQQPGVEKKIGYTTMPFFTAKSALLKSGLMGPVSLESIQ